MTKTYERSWRKIFFFLKAAAPPLRRLRRLLGGYAAYLYVCCLTGRLLQYTGWLLLSDTDFYKQTSAFFLFVIFYYHVLLPIVWRWLTLPEHISILVIVLSVLCGWVPLYWRTYLLMSDTEVCAAPTALRTHGRVALQLMIDTWDSSYL